MGEPSRAWVILRIGVLVVIVASVAASGSVQSNIGWFFVPIPAAASAVFLYAWLSSWQRRPNVDISAPLSVSLPFWPMSIYPVRYWLLVSVSLMLGGVLAVGGDYLRGGHDIPFGVTFLGVGVGLMVALIPWLRK